MLSVDDVARWLVAPVNAGGAGLTERVVPGPTIPTQPDRLVVLTRYGGPGAVEENLFEVLAFQARCRGSGGRGVRAYGPGASEVVDDGLTNAYLDAEMLAATVDKILLDAPYPCYVNGVRVRSIIGGPPQFLTQEQGGRVHFTANYLFTAAR